MILLDLTTASATGVFRLLLILVLLYYGFKLLVRYVFPYFLKRFVNNAQKNFYKQNPHLDPDQAKKEEGNVHVNNKNTKSKHQQNDFGDYVDYEEIKE